MKKDKLILGLLLVCAGVSVAQNARSLFMSTAGSEVLYRQEEKVQGQTKPVARKETHRVQPRVYYGMSVQVYAERNGRLVPVDPTRYTFRTGDRFKVKVFYNSPGIVEFVNVDPQGRENYLGKWVVEEAFTGTMLPADGYFKFTGTKGRELLIVRFMPCAPRDRKMVEEINMASSRAITVVREAEVKPTSFSASLPACGEMPKMENYREYITASSRGIMVVHEQVEKRTYYFVSQDSYQREGQPITAVLELKHR